MARMNLGAAIAGGNGSRRDDDFYPTPPEATIALLNVASKYIGPVVHEPACGDGAMAKLLKLSGRDVIATDLVDRGYGRGGVNYLEGPSLAPSVVTNPPFKIAAEFVEHGCAQEPEFFALLLKATFWNAARRVDLFRRFPPRMVLPLAWRLDFTGGGAPTMDCMWCAWGSNLPDGVILQPLQKPTLGIFA